MARLRRMPREIYRVHDGEDFHDRADGEGERAEPGNTPWRSGPGLRRAAAAVAVLGAVGTVILHTRPVRDGIRVLVPSGGLHTADGSPPPGRHTFRNRRAPASSLSRSRPRYTPGSPVRRRQPPRSAGWLPVRDARKTDASSETRAEQQPSFIKSGATNDRETSRGSRQCAPYVAAPCGDRSTTLPPWAARLGPRHRRECPVRGSAAKGAVTVAPGDRHRASRIGCRGLCTALRSQLPELERRRTAEQCARP